MMQKGTVVFLITGLAVGGAEVQVVHLATRMRKRGWRVAVISMTSPSAFVEDLRRAGVAVRDLRMEPGRPDPRGLMNLAHQLRKLRPDVLHSHMIHANILGRLVRQLVRIPVVISTAHSIDEGGGWRKWAYSYTDRWSDLTTNVSAAAVNRYIGIGAVPATKIREVPNGVDVNRFHSAPAVRSALRTELGVGDRFCWLSVGRLDVAKDPVTLLRAVARARLNFPSLLLLVAGDGELRSATRTEMSRLGLDDGTVRLLGTRRDIPALMQAADGFVSSSVLEGLPMALLEASASGLPIVTTSVGGVPEVVSDGHTGFLVPPREPDLLAGQMERVMRLPLADRYRMGEQGRTRIRGKYDIRAIVEEWERVYLNLLAQRTSAASQRG